MKGILQRTQKGTWVVREYDGKRPHFKEILLHPEDAKFCNDYGDYSIDWIGKEVDFEIVTEEKQNRFSDGEWDRSYSTFTYAKFITRENSTPARKVSVGEQTKELLKEIEEEKENELKEELIGFQIFLNDQMLISNHDCGYEDVAKKYIQSLKK